MLVTRCRECNACVATGAMRRSSADRLALERTIRLHVHDPGAERVVVDLRTPRAAAAEGRAEPHHLLANSGWVSFYLREPADIDAAIALLHESYGLAIAQRNARIERG